MRLSLDTSRNLLLTLPTDEAPPASLALALGAPPLRLVVSGDPLLPLLDAGGSLVTARIELIVKAAIDGSQLLAAAAEIDSLPAAGAAQTIELAEDWSSGLLVLLFDPDTAYVDLLLQYRYASGVQAAAEQWVYSPQIALRLENTLFPSVLIPGAMELAGQLYIASITEYTGGSAAALDALPTPAIPTGTVVRIITTNGESAWQLVAGTTAEDSEAGIIRPDDYNASTNARIWSRVAGL